MTLHLSSIASVPERADAPDIGNPPRCRPENLFRAAYTGGTTHWNYHHDEHECWQMLHPSYFDSVRDLIKPRDWFFVSTPSGANILWARPTADGFIMETVA